jgi:hypothetical protein
VQELDDASCKQVAAHRRGRMCVRSPLRPAERGGHGRTSLVLVAYDTAAKIESVLRAPPRPPSADVQDCATSYARLTPTLPVFRDQFEQWRRLGEKATRLDVTVLFNLLDFAGAMAE